MIGKCFLCDAPTESLIHAHDHCIKEFRRERTARDIILESTEEEMREAMGDKAFVESVMKGKDIVGKAKASARLHHVQLRKAITLICSHCEGRDGNREACECPVWRMDKESREWLEKKKNSK
jgi:hypothetical protein